MRRQCLRVSKIRLSMNEILEVDYVIEMFQIEDFAEFGVISSDGLKVVVKCKTNYVNLGPQILTVVYKACTEYPS